MSSAGYQWHSRVEGRLGGLVERSPIIDPGSSHISRFDVRPRGTTYVYTEDNREKKRCDGDTKPVG